MQESLWSQLAHKVHDICNGSYEKVKPWENYVQWNSLNLKADSTKILIFWKLRKPVPSVEVKQAHLKDMFKVAFKSVCTSPCLLVLQHTWLNVKRLQKTEGDYDAPEPVDEGDIQIEYSSD